VGGEKVGRPIKMADCSGFPWQNFFVVKNLELRFGITRHRTETSHIAQNLSLHFKVRYKRF
jgi:hypothetical protein